MNVPGTDPRLEAIRYPIGRFESQELYTEADRRECLQRFELAPKRLAVAVRGLGDAHLDTPTRAGGWTARQVVHHLADNVLNASVHVRWALTEDEPTIKPWNQGAWAALPDAHSGPIAPSLLLFEGATARLARLFGSLAPRHWTLRFYHPEARAHCRLDAALALEAWHHEHHVAQISSLRARAGWKV